MGQEAYSHDISRMSPTLLQKAVFAKEASREYHHQNILATAWKLEELKRHIDLMEGFQEENKLHYGISSNELNLFESFLLNDDLTAMRAKYRAVAHTYHEDVTGLTLTDEELDCLVEKGFGDGEARELAG